MAKGFFSKDELSAVQVTRQTIVKKERPFTGTCKECKLYQQCNSPKMSCKGEGKKGILLVLEYPTEEEDRQGEFFCGQSGKVIKNIFNELDIDVEEDCWYTYAVRCRPSNPDKIKPVTIAACRKFALETLDALKPKVVITFGKAAMDVLVGARMTGRLSNVTNQDWVGSQIPDQELKVRIFPTWNPKFVFYQGRDDRIDVVLRKQIESHVKMAVQTAELNTPFYETAYNGECIAVYDSIEAIKIIEQMQDAEAVAFDYETTGIKPYRDGQEIYTVSVSDGAFSYAFPYFNDKDFRKAWLDLMRSDTPKIAHNKKFEMLWTKVRGGYNNTEGCWPKNIFWDTMLAAHQMHNLKKTNLKFKTYTLLGIAGYDNAIDHYLQATKDDEDKWGTNAFNRIKEAPLDEVLKYNAMDSLFTYKLYEYQYRRINPHLKKGLELEMTGAEVLVQTEYNGLICDVNELARSKGIMTKKMDFLENEIRTSKEIKNFSLNKTFSLTNPQHLSHLVFNDLGFKTDKKTATGKNKADKEVFTSYNIGVVNDILEWKRWSKARDTYVASFQREITDGVIHPFFHLHIVPSYRSGSSDINFQNIPKRDPKVATLLRRTLKCRPGHKFAEYDYASQEVRIIASLNKDPTLIKYIEDGFDMHREMGAKIFVREPKDVSKKERYFAKNGFVFPTFYGSYYKKTAQEIWNMMEPESKIWVKGKGLRTLDDFIEHMRVIEDEFWYDRFPVAREYKEKIIADYESKGFVELPTGFRCYGPMSHNEILNYPVQGSAFHCLLWTFTQMNKSINKMNLDTKLIGQIHDSTVADINPEEEELFDHLIWKFGTQKIREHWEWIAVPLGIEKSISPINGDWNSVEEIGLLTGE